MSKKLEQDSQQLENNNDIEESEDMVENVRDEISENIKDEISGYKYSNDFSGTGPGIYDLNSLNNFVFMDLLFFSH